MIHFEFATASKIVFGLGVLAQVPSRAAVLGKCALLVTGRSLERSAHLAETLRQNGMEIVRFRVAGEPTIEDIRAGLSLARDHCCDVVIALGGGSAIDAAKAIAILVTNPGDVRDYLEVIGLGKPLLQPGLPMVAIPATSGTGSEVTRNAVLSARDAQVKVSLRGEYMLPRLAVVDPELTLSLPVGITAACGMDALSQLIEPFVCNQPNPLVDAICRQGMLLVSSHLPRVCRDGMDLEARTGMSAASLFSGLALANSRLGAVHGFAAPLGGLVAAPHGAVCARLLPEVMRVNFSALSKRLPGSPAIERYSQVARILTGDPHASALDGVRWLEGLIRELQIPGLSAYGIAESDIPVLVERSAKASSMKGNPVPLTSDEMHGILERALDEV